MGDLWACPECIRRGYGDVNLWRTPHCTECGAKMVKVECQKCRTPLSPVTKKFCTNCGEDVSKQRTKFDKLLQKPKSIALPPLLPSLAESPVEPSGTPTSSPAPEEPAEPEPSMEFTAGVEERNY